MHATRKAYSSVFECDDEALILLHLRLHVFVCDADIIGYLPIRCMMKENLHDDTRIGSDTLMQMLANTLRVRRLLLTGQSSAASFPTGPVIAEPFISPLGLTICQACQSPAPAMYIRTVGTYNTGIVLKVEEDAVCSSPWLALSDDNCWHDLLSEFWLSLLDCGHDHVTDTCCWQTVEPGTESLHRDNVEVSCSRVVCAVHDCTAMQLSVSFSPNVLVFFLALRPALVHLGMWNRSETYTGRPRVILSLLPEAAPLDFVSKQRDSSRIS